MSNMKLKSKSKTQLWAKVFSILFCISIIASLFLYINNNFFQRSDGLAPNEVFQKNSREYVGIWGRFKIHFNVFFFERCHADKETCSDGTSDLSQKACPYSMDNRFLFIIRNCAFSFLESNSYI